MKKVLKYGIVGFSRNAFDKKPDRLILHRLFKTAKHKHGDKEIEIVSGYTKSGIPEVAYELAEGFGLTTVGFSAQQALKIKSGVYPVDEAILHGEKFGDESANFVEYVDGLIRVGGGPQSRKEVELFKAIHPDESLDALLKEFEVDWYGK